MLIIYLHFKDYNKITNVYYYLRKLSLYWRSNKMKTLVVFLKELKSERMLTLFDPKWLKGTFLTHLTCYIQKPQVD